MLEADGVVISAFEGTAEVSVIPRSACSSCSANSACGTSLVAGLLAKRSSRFSVTNSVAAEVGEQVVIGLHESSLQFAALVVYLMPLTGLMLGAMGGVYLSEHILHRPSELPSILLGFAGMGTGLILVKYFGRYAGKVGRYQAEILRVTRKEKS